MHAKAAGYSRVFKWSPSNFLGLRELPRTVSGTTKKTFSPNFYLGYDYSIVETKDSAFKLLSNVFHCNGLKKFSKLYVADLL